MTPRWVRWIVRGVLAVGVVLLVIGLVSLVRTMQFVADAEHATGTVVDLSAKADDEGGILFHPVVRFTTADGEVIEFVSSTGSAPASESPGDRVEVLYDPDDPNGAKLSGFTHIWLLPTILLFIAVMFLLVGGGSLVARRLLSRRGPSEADIQWLRLHGRRMTGRSPRVVYNDSLVVEGASPFVVHVDVHDPERDQVRVLTSGYVWFDPTPYVEGRDALDVYIDPERPDRYFIDLSFLPSQAPSG